MDSCKETRCASCGPLAELAFDELRDAVVCKRCNTQTDTRQSNGLTFCSNCKAFALVVDDPSTGCSVCRGCGLVHSMFLLMDTDEPQRVRDKIDGVDMRAPDATDEPWKAGNGGIVLSKIGTTDKRMIAEQIKLQYDDTGEKLRHDRYKRGLGFVDKLCLQLDLPLVTSNKAKEYWGAIFKQESGTGRKLHGWEMLCAAVLHIASLELQTPVLVERLAMAVTGVRVSDKFSEADIIRLRKEHDVKQRRRLQHALGRKDVSSAMRNPILDFTTPYQRETKRVRNAVKRVRTYLKLAPLSAQQLIVAYCHGYVAHRKLPSKTTETCEYLVGQYMAWEKTSLVGMPEDKTTRRKAYNFAASFVYLACKHFQIECTQRDLSRVYGTSSNVISRGCTDIRAALRL